MEEGALSFLPFLYTTAFGPSSLSPFNTTRVYVPQAGASTASLPLAPKEDEETQERGKERRKLTNLCLERDLSLSPFCL